MWRRGGGEKEPQPGSAAATNMTARAFWLLCLLLGSSPEALVAERKGKRGAEEMLSPGEGPGLGAGCGERRDGRGSQVCVGAPKSQSVLPRPCRQSARGAATERTQRAGRAGGRAGGNCTEVAATLLRSEVSKGARAGQRGAPRATPLLGAQPDSDAPTPAGPKEHLTLDTRILANAMQGAKGRKRGVRKAGLLCRAGGVFVWLFSGVLRESLSLGKTASAPHGAIFLGLFFHMEIE